MQMLKRFAKWFLKSVIHYRFEILGILALCYFLLLFSGHMPGGNNTPMKQLPEGRTVMVPQQSPAPAADTFIAGLTAYDASVIWNVLSPEMKNRLKSQGVTMESLQEQMTEAQTDGVRLVDITYVGAYKNAEGNTMYFYGLGREESGQVKPQFYVLTVNSDGHILNME